MVLNLFRPRLHYIVYISPSMRVAMNGVILCDIIPFPVQSSLPQSIHFAREASGQRVTDAMYVGVVIMSQLF